MPAPRARTLLARRWPSLARHWPSLARLWPGAVVAAMIVAYVLFFGALTIQKHHAFQTTAFDLGNFDQAVWNTRHGRPFAMTNIEGLENRLGTHVEPILLPISLLYFLWSDPRALLLLQTVVIALGAWAVLLLAYWVLDIGYWEGAGDRRGTGLKALAVVLAGAYLMFPALQSANAFDFHAVALAPTFFLFAFYFLERERWAAFATFALLTMACKEDMPLLVAMLGLYALVVRRRWIAGLATMAVAAAWFLLAVGWIMPHFDTQAVSPLANRYAYLGDGPLEMAATLLTRPGVVLEHALTRGNLFYLLKLLAPVAFLPLLAPQVLLLALPPLAVNLLSTDGFMHQLEGFHYGLTLVPVAVASALYGARWLLRRLPRFRALPWLLAGLVLLAGLAYHRAYGYTPLAAGFRDTWPHITDHDRLGEEIARSIPAEASLAALPYPNPHASQRRQLSMIDRIEDGLPAPLPDAASDYIWLDATDSWPLHPNDLKQGVDNLLAREYGLEWAEDGWLLLRRGAPQRTLPAGFYDFARAAEASPEYPLVLRFYLPGEDPASAQPALECLGFDLEREPGTGAYSLGLYWRALRPLPDDLWLYPYYFDDAGGQVLEDTALRPMVATVWYPPQRWQVGEVVRTETLPWQIGPTFSVGLGVVQGDDWGQVDRRLPLRLESSDLIVRLFDGDTWARLLHVEEGQVVEETRTFAPPSPRHALEADLGGQIRLLGYDLDYDRAGAEPALDLTLYFQALTRPEAGYSLFVQLLGPTGNVRSQADAIPADYPTQWWLPGEVVAAPLSLPLPPDAPPGAAFRLIAGLYDPATGDRLPVAGTAADFVELRTVTK